MEHHTIILDDMDAWREFSSVNRDVLLDEYGSVENALRHALDGGLRLGGGASPIINICFADCE
jgi:hypothetical protein